jgi:hypothetical protein
LEYCTPAGRPTAAGKGSSRQQIKAAATAGAKAREDQLRLR